MLFYYSFDSYGSAVSTTYVKYVKSLTIEIGYCSFGLINTPFKSPLFKIIVCTCAGWAHDDHCFFDHTWLSALIFVCRHILPPLRCLLQTCWNLQGWCWHPPNVLKALQGSCLPCLWLAASGCPPFHHLFPTDLILPGCFCRFSGLGLLGSESVVILAVRRHRGPCPSSCCSSWFPWSFHFLL